MDENKTLSEKILSKLMIIIEGQRRIEANTALIGKILSILRILVSGQKRIEANTVQIAQMLEAFSKKYEFNINNGINFIITGMTEAQAKSLLKQGMYPEIVALYSGNKFTVEHLYKLINGGKKL